MARNAGRTKPCSARVRRGRMNKAEEFLEHAQVAGADAPDTCVSLAVLAGIAAADVICCIRMGEHAAGDDHQRAVVLLKQANAGAATQLNRLLAQKSRAGYSDLAMTPRQAEQALRAAAALVELALSMS